MLGLRIKYKYYDSIHNLPMQIWDTINAGGAYSELVYKGKTKDDLRPVWAKIYDEYLAEFGLNKAYKEYIELLVDEAELLEDCYINGNKLSRTFANVKAQEAEQLIKGLGTNSHSTTLAHVSKFMGFSVNLMKVTVFEYMGYLKLMNG